MKNVEDFQLKRCILKELDEFRRDVADAVGPDIEVSCDYDGIYFDRDEQRLLIEPILIALSVYYGVTVTSIHIDDSDLVGVWICYK